MSKIKLHQGDWVVVCDGAKALILENVGDEMFPNLRTRETFAHDDPPTHEIGTDAPGRSFSSVGSGRSAVQQTDWHTQAEQRFLQELAGRLDAAVSSGEVKRLVVIAPPRALGVLRHAYSPALRDHVFQELDKDYVHLPVHEIEKHVVGA